MCPLYVSGGYEYNALMITWGHVVGYVWLIVSLHIRLEYHFEVLFEI